MRIITWANKQAMIATVFSESIRYRCSKKEVHISIVQHPAELLATLARGGSAVVSMDWAVKLISLRGDFRVEDLRFANQSAGDFVVIGRNPLVLWEDREGKE
jgi:hypothetical protein